MASAGGVDDDGERDVVLKILVIGDHDVGKTSIIKRSIMNDFAEDYKPTVGVDFHLKYFDVGTIRGSLQLFHTHIVAPLHISIAGYDRFGAIFRVFYRDAFGALLVFDYTSKKSFESIEVWKNEIRSKVTLPDGSPLPVLLVANKSDLSDRRDVSMDEAKEYATRNGFVGLVETSAKTGDNVEQAIYTLVKSIGAHPGAFKAHEDAKRAKREDHERVAVAARGGLAEEAEGGCC